MAGKKRIELIDLIKALTIFCVIWGHAAGNDDAPFYRELLYTFHMPLFFFLAGMSMRAKTLGGRQARLQFLKHNFLALMVPYFIWGLIYSQSTYDNITRLLYGSWEGLCSMQTLTSLWFLPCMFVARVIIQVIMDLVEGRMDGQPESRRTGVYAAAMAALFAVGLLLPHGNGWFWCSDIAFVAAGFMLGGLLLKKQLLVLAQQKAAVLGAVFAGSVLLFAGGVILKPDSLILMRMCAAEYGNVFWLFYYSITGSMIVITLSMLLARAAHEGLHPFSVRYFTFVGMHTMGIYLLHKPILQNLVYPAVLRLLPNVPDVVTSCIGAVIMLPITCGLCFVIERFIPELLGQFPREK